nr:F-box domain, leucine-rich repeat domain, L domain-like protein [Tanacetum cinerariifolium]
MMSDSDGGDLSDVDDFDDLDMIMQQVQSEQQREEEAQRVRHRKYIYRKRLDAEARLMADYFDGGDLSDVDDFDDLDMIMQHVQSEQQREEEAERTILVLTIFKVVSGSSVIRKCTCAIRQLAYGVTPDSLDVYLQMERNALFKQKQESARKDIERAFGILQGRCVGSSKKMNEKTIDATDRITLLPDFIVHHILSFLLDDPKSHVRMSLV